MPPMGAGFRRAGAAGAPCGLGGEDGFVCGCMVEVPMGSLSLVPAETPAFPTA